MHGGPILLGKPVIDRLTGQGCGRSVRAFGFRAEAPIQRLKSLTGPFILRRLKTDKAIITDLPEKMEMKVFCTLTKEAALLKRLGGFPFWRGEERFLEAIEPIYTQASPCGLEIFLTWR